MPHRLLVLLGLSVAILPLCTAAARAQKVSVLAAVSLTDAMKELGAAWAAKGNLRPRYMSVAARSVAFGLPLAILADTLVLLDHGGVQASGPIEFIATWTDLPGFSQRRDAGAVLSCTIARHDSGRGLT